MSPRNKKNEQGAASTSSSSSSAAAVELMIKYNHRFRVPTSDQILKALKPKNGASSSRRLVSKYDRQFEKLLKHFDELPKPKSESDWLVQFHELGQTCEQFLRTCPNSAQRMNLGRKRFIYYVQIGEFSQTNLPYDSLIEYSECFFGSNGVIRRMDERIDIRMVRKPTATGGGGTVMEIHASYGNLTRKLKYRCENRRVQILAQSLHKFLYAIKPQDACCLVGFCEYDLYAEESDLFVAGLCDGDLRVGAFSCFRYHPRLKYCDENWFDARLVKSSSRNQQSQPSSSSAVTSADSESNNDSLLLVRSCKLLVHETCHLLGMEHCIYLNCCMNGSGHLEEDFGQSMFLCPIDLKKLWLIVNFDLIKRYKAMREFFDKNDAKSESQWLSKVITALEE
jgi:archaemetzincin